MTYLNFIKVYYGLNIEELQIFRKTCKYAIISLFKKNSNHGENMKKRALLLITLLLIGNLAMAEKFTAGKDYHFIKEVKTTILATPNTTAKNKVQVIEFFSYGCPWCNFAEASVATWEKNKPSYIEFSRIPLAFEKGWDTYAQAYYLAEALGVEKKITPALFLAIHGKDGLQNNDLSSPNKVIKFFVKHGVKRSIAETAFNSNSASLQAQLQQGPAAMKKYSVWAIPAFVIAGKYRVSMADAKKAPRLMKIVSYLAAKVHKQEKRHKKNGSHKKGKARKK